ncbi:hypothetical protein BVRB_021110, partial [Beta vulgaris subsp. vulgaris]
RISISKGDQIQEVSIEPFSTNALPLLDESAKLQLSVGDDWLPIKDISIARAGAVSFWVLGYKPSNKNHSVRIIVEVIDTGSSKMVQVHSDQQILNHTSIAVNISGFVIKSQQSLWLPAFSYDPSSLLRVSVAGSSSKAFLDFSQDTSWLMFNSKDNGPLLCFQAERRKELCNAYAIHLKPTRTVQNLLSVSCKLLCTIRNSSWQDQSPVMSPSDEHPLMIDPKEDIQLQIILPFMESVG